MTTPTPPPEGLRRRRRNSSRTNLIVSLVFHSAIVVALFFFAAREGMLGKELRKIAVTMAPKEKPPEKPKEKPPELKVEPPKETPKLAQAPKTAPAAAPRVAAAAPPPVVSSPVAAPPAASIPGFEFEGGKAVISTTNVVELYKGQVEYAFRAHWVRPDGIADDAYTAEVQVKIDPTGRVVGSEWRRGSGHADWDNSVRKAIQQTPSISRPPPKGFPDRFTIRFDVGSEAESLDQASLP